MAIELVVPSNVVALPIFKTCRDSACDRSFDACANQPSVECLGVTQCDDAGLQYGFGADVLVAALSIKKSGDRHQIVRSRREVEHMCWHFADGTSPPSAF